MNEKDLQILQTAILILDGATDSEIMFNNLLPFRKKAIEVIRVLRTN